MGDGLRQDAGPRFARIDIVDQDHVSIKTVQDEISYYGVSGVISVSDLARKETQIQPTHIKSLRIMHCSELTSLKGVEAYTNLTDLNASSNNLLSMNGLE